MTGIQNLTRFLDPDPQDIGCDATFALLDRYVERALHGDDAPARFPGVATHLAACPPCAADLEGLLSAAGRAPV